MAKISNENWRWEHAANSLHVLSDCAYLADKVLRMRKKDGLAQHLRDIEGNIEEIRRILRIED